MKNLQQILEKSREAEKEHPSHICEYKSAFFRCTRQKYKHEKYCFWHIEDENKFRQEFSSDFLNASSKIGEALKDALEAEVKNGMSLEGVYLKNLNLTHMQPEFSCADFTDAVLEGFHFGYGNLKGVNFTGADLTNSNLCDTVLTGANFTGARLHNVKLRNNEFIQTKGISKNSFMGLCFGVFPTYKINELKNTEGVCAETYRKLKLYFNEMGNFDDASWAAYKEKVMQRKVLRSQPNPMIVLLKSYFTNRNMPHMLRIKMSFAESLVNIVKYLLSHIYSIVFGYGEKPIRVMSVSGVIILLYS